MEFDQVILDFIRDNPGAATIGSALVAALALLFNLLNTLVIARLNEQNKLARDEADRLRYLSDRERSLWGQRAIEAISDTHKFIQTSGVAVPTAIGTPARDRLQASLSTLLDIGRIYFPNQFDDWTYHYWQAKPAANRGFRPPILDYLFIAYRELELVDVTDADQVNSASRTVFECRRHFTSELQRAMLPRDGRTKKFAKEPYARSRGHSYSEPNWEIVKQLVGTLEQRYGVKYWDHEPCGAEGLLRLGARPPVKPIDIFGFRFRA